MFIWYSGTIPRILSNKSGNDLWEKLLSLYAIKDDVIRLPNAFNGEKKNICLPTDFNTDAFVN